MSILEKPAFKLLLIGNKIKKEGLYQRSPSFFISYSIEVIVAEALSIAATNTITSIMIAAYAA